MDLDDVNGKQRNVNELQNLILFCNAETHVSIVDPIL